MLRGQEMWLDRLSNSTPTGSPPPTKRAYSPAPPRRQTGHTPNSTQRPPFNARASSLSLGSNDSTTSLLASRRPTASTLKQVTTVSNVPNPLDVLEKLLGSEGMDEVKAKPATNGVHNTLGEVGFELDFGGLSLQELALADSSPVEDSVYNSQTIEECMYSRDCIPTLTDDFLDELDKEKFEDLHRSIRACDDVLTSVEINLTSFQNDLATVSAEIETLQARSTALSVRLENRKLVEHALGPIVEEISLSPAVVRKIVEGVIDETWVRALAEVEKRSKAMDMKSKELRNIKGIGDLKPLLDNLIKKVSNFL
jgi:hypothetical protein